MSTSIYKEINNIWTEKHQEAGIVAPNLAEFGTILLRTRKECKIQNKKNLQPWLGIFEFGLQWLANLHTAFVLDKDSLPKAPATAPWLLIGTGCSYGLAIRNLIIDGLDTPARALLRSFTDTLLLCLAVLDDHELGNTFSSAQSPEDVKSFWHKTISPKKLHERIMAVERSFGLDKSHSGEVENTIKELSEWRKVNYDILSQAVHPSYLTSVLNCFAPNHEDQEALEPAFLGKSSSNSKLTISYAAITLWYFSRFGYLYIFEGKGNIPSLVGLDKFDESHRFVLIGRDVLSRLTLKYWDAWEV